MLENKGEATDRKNERNHSGALTNPTCPEENECEAHSGSYDDVLEPGTLEQDICPAEKEAHVGSISLASSSEDRHTKDSKAEPTTIDEQRRMTERRVSTADTPSSSTKKKRPFSLALLGSLLLIDHTQISFVPPVSTLVEPAK